MIFSSSSVFFTVHRFQDLSNTLIPMRFAFQPRYIFLISDLAGERRFAASVAKRLESLGALTHADRRATDTRDLSQFNVENKYGKAALRTVYNTINGRTNEDSLPPPADYKGDFFDDLSNALAGVGLLEEEIDGLAKTRTMKDKDKTDIAKFLNRILGLKVKLQNQLFKYFMDSMDKVISDAKKSGKYDMGILGKCLLICLCLILFFLRFEMVKINSHKTSLK